MRRTLNTLVLVFLSGPSHAYVRYEKEEYLHQHAAVPMTELEAVDEPHSWVYVVSFGPSDNRPTFEIDPAFAEDGTKGGAR